MTLTLLLDLDDTLLGNDIDEFIKIYMGLLSKHLAPYVDPQIMIPALWSGTKAMMLNQDPELTLENAFDRIFYPAIGIEKEQVRSILEKFYREIFPSLQTYTRRFSEAAMVVNEALRRGYRVGIATNPLFPLLAIEHRISWAGVPVEEIPFSLVPSYETFHFAKPNPAFFTEYLGRLGWPEGPVLMVGDSLENDIRGARTAGLAAYWITQAGETLPTDGYRPNGSGTLVDLLRWIDSQPKDTLVPDFQTSSSLLAVLRATPAVFDHMARTLPASAWKQCPSEEEWCLAEIVCHLRDVEAEVNLSRLKKFADEINPFLVGENTDPWAVEREYIKQDHLNALLTFTRSRIELLSLLERLEVGEWKQTARHSIFGPTDLHEMVQIMAGHDRLHIQQAYKAIAQDGTAGNGHLM